MRQSTVQAKMRRYSSQVAWSDQDQAYIATSVEFPLLSAVSETPEEALHELQLAITVAVEAFINDGETPPEPLHVTEFSGQFRLRLGRTQHAELVARAQRERLSLNSYVTQLVSTALGESRADSRTAEQLHELRRELRLRSLKTSLRVEDTAVGLGGTPLADVYTAETADRNAGKWQD